MQEHTLKNGLKVVFVDRPGSVLGISLVGRAGSLFGKPGVAHFLEHTVLCATEKYPEFTLLANSIDNLGLYRNAYTSYENIGFVFKCLPNHFAQVCEFLSEVAVRPLFLETDIEKQKKIITQEIRRLLSDTAGFAYVKAMRQAYGDSGAGIPILGGEDDIARITRDDLVGFFRKHFVAGNFTLVIAGEIDKQKAIETIGGSLGAMPAGLRVPPMAVTNMISPRTEIEKRKGISQAHLTMTWKAYLSSDSKTYAAYLLRCLLTDGRLSRLWQALRQETGMVYSVSGRLAKAESFGHLSITTGLASENVRTAITRISDEIRKIAEGGVSDLDLERAKNLARAHIAFDTDSALGCAEYYAMHLATDPSFGGADHEVHTYAEVGKEEIMRTASEMLEAGAHITVIEPAV